MLVCKFLPLIHKIWPKSRSTLGTTLSQGIVSPTEHSPNVVFTKLWASWRKSEFISVWTCALVGIGPASAWLRSFCTPAWNDMKIDIKATNNPIHMHIVGICTALVVAFFPRTFTLSFPWTSTLSSPFETLFSASATATYLSVSNRCLKEGWTIDPSNSFTISLAWGLSPGLLLIHFRVRFIRGWSSPMAQINLCLRSASETATSLPDS